MGGPSGRKMNTAQVTEGHGLVLSFVRAVFGQRIQAANLSTYSWHTSGSGQYVNALTTGHHTRSMTMGFECFLYMECCAQVSLFSLSVLSTVFLFPDTVMKLWETKYIAQGHATNYYNKQDLNPGW